MDLFSLNEKFKIESVVRKADILSTVKFRTLVPSQNEKTNSADPDQTASEGAV